jgi:PAS domain S-box-containing protein
MAILLLALSPRAARQFRMPDQPRATILLLEDDPGIARLETVCLQRAGYAVISAETADTGMSKIAEGGIELILLDQRLNSGMSGLEFFRRVKAEGYDIPAILVTGMQEETLLVDALRAGVRDFVPKTQNFLNHLEPIVGRVLDQVRTERELAESRIVAREHEQKRRELESEIAQRQRVEQALRDAQQYLRLVFESVKDFAIFTIDLHGCIVSWNPGAEQVFGYSEAEILGQSLATLYTEEDRAAGVHEQEIAEAAARGRSTDERWHLRKDGSRFFASGVVNPIFDDAYRLRGFTKIARDVTERKQAEEAVREAAVRLKAIFDAAVDGILAFDEQGVIESMNPAAERIFGYTSSEVVGSNVSLFMPNSNGSEQDDSVEDYLRTGRQSIIGVIREVTGKRRDGSIFPMELAISETRLGNRRIFTGIVRDITEYKHTVLERMGLFAELQAERALLNTLLDNAPVGIGLFDPQLRYLRLNPALADINGLPIEAHLGRTISEVLPRMSAAVGEAFRHVLETGQSIVNAEIRGETPKLPGQDRYWLYNFYPVKTSDGTLLGAGAIVTDIDDRKRMEQALREDDQRKDQFLAMLAHELRNPLAPISNAVQIMKVEGLGGRNSEWSIKVIEDQIKHMTRMVDDLLDVSRITRGKVDLQKELVELRDIVNLAVEASRPLLQDCSHELNIAVPEAPILLDVDPARMAQVLSNLLNNAAKYTDEGGKISLSATRTGHDVLIKVRDNGIGIPADLLPRVFDMFTQADQSLSRSRGGLGIGLTLVRSLVEMHNGRVSAQSEGIGNGSEFTIRLPVAQKRSNEKNGPHTESEREVKALPRRRILVVDDNLSNATSLGMLLSALGQEVETAYDGLTALDLVRRHQPEFVLLDIGLPGMDGYEVARQCRRDTELDRVTLVAMTGYGQDEDRKRSQEAGFNAHLVKPVNLEDLRLLLDEPGLASA